MTNVTECIYSSELEKIKNVSMPVRSAVLGLYCGFLPRITVQQKEDEAIKLWELKYQQPLTAALIRIRNQLPISVTTILTLGKENFLKRNRIGIGQTLQSVLEDIYPQMVNVYSDDHWLAFSDFHYEFLTSQFHSLAEISPLTPSVYRELTLCLEKDKYADLRNSVSLQLIARPGYLFTNLAQELIGGNSQMLLNYDSHNLPVNWSTSLKDYFISSLYPAPMVTVDLVNQTYIFFKELVNDPSMARCMELPEKKKVITNLSSNRLAQLSALSVNYSSPLDIDEVSQVCIEPSLEEAINELNKINSLLLALGKHWENQSVSFSTEERNSLLMIDGIKPEDLNVVCFSMESIAERFSHILAAIIKHLDKLIPLIVGVVVALLGWWLTKSKESDVKVKTAKDSIKEAKNVIETVTNGYHGAVPSKAELGVSTTVTSATLYSIENTYKTELDTLIVLGHDGYTQEHILQTINAHVDVMRAVIASSTRVLDELTNMVSNEASVSSVIKITSALEKEYYFLDFHLIHHTLKPMYAAIKAAHGHLPAPSPTFTLLNRNVNFTVGPEHSWWTGKVSQDKLTAPKSGDWSYYVPVKNVTHGNHTLVIDKMSSLKEIDSRHLERSLQEGKDLKNDGIKLSKKAGKLYQQLSSDNNDLSNSPLMKDPERFTPWKAGGTQVQFLPTVMLSSSGLMPLKLSSIIMLMHSLYDIRSVALRVNDIVKAHASLLHAQAAEEKAYAKALTEFIKKQR